MSDHIPHHLLANVLLRLPFDSLLQSRRVSKSWRALIDSPEFVRMHFNTYYLKSNSQGAAGSTRIVSLSQNKFYSIDFQDIGSGKVTAKRLNCPLDHPETEEVRLVGSCNGLLCLIYPNRSKVLVWNPWIQKSLELPSPPVEYSMFGGADSLIGFGYDHVNDDYKVLNKMRFYDVFDEDQSSWFDQVYVYSFKFKSWRRMEHFQSKLWDSSYIIPHDCTFVNGALHWMMQEKDGNGVIINIMAFDLNSEEFHKVPCPRRPEKSYCNEKLRGLNGFLCCIFFHYDEIERKWADLWLMEQYGVMGSWTRLTSIEMPFHNWMCWSFTPLAYWDNKRSLLLQMDEKQFVVYEVETQSISDIAISGEEVSHLHSFVNVGSLITPL